MTIIRPGKKLRIVVFAFMVVMALPFTAFSKDKHKGRGRGRDFDQFSRKCEKFVNCHDARDGHWDGRGPQRDRNDNRLWHRNRDERRFDFDRRRDNDEFVREQRRANRQRFYDNYRSGSGSRFQDLLRNFLPF